MNTTDRLGEEVAPARKQSLLDDRRKSVHQRAISLLRRR